MPCGIEKLLLFQPSDCSVWSCRLFWGLPENQSDYKDFVWPFKAMSKRQKRTSVLCSASSLLGIREKWCIRATVGVCVGEGVCKCVCRGGRELTGKQKYCWFRVYVGVKRSESKTWTLWLHITAAIIKNKTKQTEMHRKREKGEKVFASQETLHVLGQLVL